MSSSPYLLVSIQRDAHSALVVQTVRGRVGRVKRRQDSWERWVGEVNGIVACVLHNFKQVHLLARY